MSTQRKAECQLSPVPMTEILGSWCGAYGHFGISMRCNNSINWSQLLQTPRSNFYRYY